MNCRRAPMLAGVLIYLFSGTTILSASGRQPSAPPPRLIDDMVGSRSYAILVPAQDGGLYLVWSHPDAAQGARLLAQHLNGFGERIWISPGREVAPHLDAARDWDAFADGQGGVVVTWIEDGFIKAKRFGPTGDSIWKDASFALSLSTGPRTSVVGGSDGSGGQYFIWTEETAQDVSVLYGQRIDAAGHRLWGNGGFRITPADTRQWRPRVLPDGQGGLLVAWRSARESISKVRAQRLGPLAAPLWPVYGVDMNPVGGSLDERPLLAAPGDGSAVLLWSEGFAGQNRIRMQRSGPDGQRLWPPEGNLLSIGNWDRWNPVDLGDRHGGVWIGWEDFRTINQSQLFLTHLDNLGQPWNLNEMAIAPAPANQARLFLADDGASGVLAGWIDNRAGVGVYLQRIDPEGHLLLGSQGLTVAANRKSPQRPQVLFIAPDRAAVVWFEKPSENHWQLYGKIVALPQFHPSR